LSSIFLATCDGDSYSKQQISTRTTTPHLHPARLLGSSNLHPNQLEGPGSSASHSRLPHRACLARAVTLACERDSPIFAPPVPSSLPQVQCLRVPLSNHLPLLATQSSLSLCIGSTGLAASPFWAASSVRAAAAASRGAVLRVPTSLYIHTDVHAHLTHAQQYIHTCRLYLPI
jgi:hypothetical protein